MLVVGEYAGQKRQRVSTNVFKVERSRKQGHSWSHEKTAFLVNDMVHKAAIVYVVVTGKVTRQQGGKHMPWCSIPMQSSRAEAE